MVILAIGVIVILVLAIIALSQASSNSSKIEIIFREMSAMRRQLNAINPPAAAKPQDVKSAELPPIPLVQAPAAAPRPVSQADVQETLNIAKRIAEEKRSAAAMCNVAPQSHIPPVPPVMAKLVQSAPKPTRQVENNYDAPIAFVKKFLFNEKSGELNVGKRLMAIGGFVILFITAIFFLRYMFHRGMITPAMQVGIIIAAGAAIAGLGNFLCIRKIQPLGQILTALGMAVTYAAFVAGMSDLYKPPVFGKTTAFVCMSIVALYGMFVSLAFNTPVIAFMSLLAGFAVPPLVSTGQNHRDVLFIYMTILNIATLGLVFARQWRVLASVAMAGTYLLFIGWMQEHYTDAQSTGTLWWLIFFGVLFIVMNLAWNLRRQVALAEYQVVSLLVNGLVAIGISSYIFKGVNNDSSAYFAWAASGVYMALALLIRAKIPADYTGRVSMLLLGLSLATYGVPLYFGERVIFLIWAFEGIMVLAVGWMYRSRLLKGVSAAVMALAFIAFLWVEARHPRIKPDWPFINQFFGRVLIISVAIAGYSLVHGFFAIRNGVFKYHKVAVAKMLTAANIVLTTGILAEYSLYAEQNGIRHETVLHFATIVLLIQSLVFTGGGLRLVMSDIATLGFIALAGAGLTALCCFVEATYRHQQLIFNMPFIGEALWILVCVYTAWDFRKHPNFSTAMTVGKYLANLAAVALWLLICAETHRYVSYAFMSESLADIWTMLVWAAYAWAVLFAGISRKYGSLQNTAMAMMFLWPLWWLFRGDMAVYQFAVPVLLAECALLAMLARKTQTDAIWGIGMVNLAGAFIMILIIYNRAIGDLQLIFNRPFLYALAWNAICALLAYMMRTDAENNEKLRGVSNALYSAAVIALLVLLSHEAYRYVDTQMGHTQNAWNSANIAMTLVWAGYAAAMLTVGFVWRVRPLRYFSLALLFAAGAKFILIDSVRFEGLIRIIASFSIGLIMLITAAAYHKLSAYITKTDDNSAEK